MASSCDVSTVPRSPTPDPALAAVLKHAREQRGITQETLAFHAGVSVGTLGRIETARTVPSWDTVRRIIDALNITIPQLGKLIEDQEQQCAKLTR
jgi:transcriptional regulator with XRE-family HTH domain